MNCVLQELGPIELEQFLIKDALRAIFNTILFHRQLGPTSPKEVDPEVFEGKLSYVTPNHANMKKYVDEKVEAVCSSLPTQKDNEKALVKTSLSFYTKIEGGGWFRKEDKHYWERWMVQIRVVKGGSGERHSRGSKGGRGTDGRAAQIEDLRKLLLQVIQRVDTQKDHIPPVHIEGKTTPFSFPFEIGERDESATWEVLRDLFKRGPVLNL
eukprot:g29635.t1